MPLRMDTPLPSLEGGTDWFNSEPITNEDLAGKPVLIHFWSVSCGTCKESLPDINRWVDTYKDLRIISIHMPRQESDTKVELVKEAMAEWEVKQPCVVDNWHEITNRFENKFVPAYYVFDSEHKMRHFMAGEKAIKMVEPVIERVLKAETAVDQDCSYGALQRAASEKKIVEGVSLAETGNVVFEKQLRSVQLLIFR